MKTHTTLGLTALLLTAIAGSGSAQQPTNGSGKDTAAATTKAAPDSGKKTIPTPISLFRPAEINHIRPADMRGVNVFESPKEDEVPYRGFVLSFGGAFTQEFQGLSHENSAAPVVVSGVNQQPAHDHRARLQQRRRQPERERPARPRHPRRDDVLPLGPAPSGVVGQGRLRPDGRVADRQRAAQGHHEVRDA